MIDFADGKDVMSQVAICVAVRTGKQKQQQTKKQKQTTTTKKQKEIKKTNKKTKE